MISDSHRPQVNWTAANWLRFCGEYVVCIRCCDTSALYVLVFFPLLFK